MADTTMSKAEMWPLITAQRHRLLAMLETLDDQEWEVQSLCAEWRVRDVAAHNIDTHLMTPGRFMGKFMGSGFRFNAMTARGVANHRDEPTTRLLAEYRDTATRTTAPPGPLTAMLTETVIHGNDMARPLGKRIDSPPGVLVTVASFVHKSTPLLHGKQRSEGLSLKATDVDWKTGAGPEVSGPLTSIILAISGRKDALSDLSGDGLETLRSRIS
jgi:uncharacterized protein (TIGR03083 family)